MTAKRKISLHGIFITIFTFTAISCSGSTLNRNEVEYSANDIAFINEYKSTGARYKVGKPYQIRGNWYRPQHNPSYSKTGVASWYGPNVDDITANGEYFDPEMLTAAHPTLPLPSIVKVTNLDNGRELIVRVNDRGPFTKSRVIDVSKGAARKLGMLDSGVANVHVELQQEDTLEYMERQVSRSNTPAPRAKPGIITASAARANPIVD